MKLALITPIWQRPRLTRLFLDYHAKIMCSGLFGVRICSVEDDPPMHNIPRQPSPHRFWFTRWHDNEPLSNKCTAGFQALRSMDFDAAIFLGSDDFLTVDFLWSVANAIEEQGADVVFPTAYRFMNATTGQMHQGTCQRGDSGRALSRRLLEALDFTPFERGKNRGLGGSMETRIRSLGWKDLRTAQIPEPVLCVKTDVGLWSYEHYLNRVFDSYLDAETVLREEYPTIAEDLLTWQKHASTAS